MSHDISALLSQIRALQVFRGVTFNQGKVAFTEGHKPRSRRYELVANVPSSATGGQHRHYSAAALSKAVVGLQCVLMAANAPSLAHARLSTLFANPIDIDQATQAPISLIDSITLEFSPRQITVSLAHGAYTAINIWLERTNKALAQARTEEDRAARAAARRAAMVDARGDRMEYLDDLLHQIALGRFGDGLGKDRVFHSPAAQQKLDELRQWINDLAENPQSIKDGPAFTPAHQEAA